MITLLLTTLALAQTTGGDAPSANGQLYRPVMDSQHTLWTNTSTSPEGFAARGWAHYARDPVVYVNEDGSANRVLGDVLQMDVLGSWSKGPMRLGLDVPIYVRSGGDQVGGETGLGDLIVDGRGTLVDRDEAAVGLALAMRAGLPTTTVQAPLGSRGLSFEVEGIVDKKIGRTLLAANTGVKFVPTNELENITLNDQLFVRLGAGRELGDRAGVSLDLATHLNVADMASDATPLEALVGGWGRVSDKGLVLRGGAGTGLSPGFGAPIARVVIGVGMEPPDVPDTDGDGYIDTVDQCPLQPEDFDGVADEDGCREPTVVMVSVTDPDGGLVVSEFLFSSMGGDVPGATAAPAMLYGGSYTISLSAPGYLPLTESAQIPDAETHMLSYVLEPAAKPGKLTVVIVDQDENPVAGATWGLPNSPGEDNGAMIEVDAGSYYLWAKADGYRLADKPSVRLAEGEELTYTIRLQPTKVELTAERIDIKESVYFETAKAVIKSESFGLLDDVAALLRDHPELTLIRIEGHTDSRGSASYNLELSGRRAAAVKTYLEESGIAAERLVSEGFGESKPIDDRNVAEAWEQNRRVDFFVAERSD